jgi:hypothetical protein
MSGAKSRANGWKGVSAARRGAAILALAAIGAAGCTPTVRVQPPTEPITINMNIKIEHEIRVKVDRELDSLFDEKSGEIF